MGGGLRLACALILGSAPATARAEAAPETAALSLEWAAPKGCPDRQDVLADIAGLMEPGTRLDAVAVQATVTRASAGFRLELRVQTDHGELARSLSADTCATLARAAALHVVLAATEAPAPPPVPAGAPVVATPSPPPAPAKPRSSLRGAVSIGGAVGYGALPVVTPEILFGAGLLGRRFRVDLGVAYVVPRQIRSRDERSVSALVQTTYASVRGCPRFGPPKLDVLPCVAIEAGAIRVQGHGVVDSRTVRAPWLAVALGPGLAWSPVPLVALWARAELVVPWLYPRFEVDGLGSLTRIRPVHGRFALGVELRFPRRR
ncbi:MAG TPA: hypothetical protein VFG69_18060 [Nannocystaceae bacterium]|nr:hypothetical protein [Nannocystaceae bacterium]